jgi:drug/metabolite transporter (DMT)-like permease
MPPAPRSAALPPLVLASLAVVYVVWSSTYLALRYAVEVLPPLLAAGARYLAAGAALLVILRARGAPLPSRGEWARSIPVGALMFLVGNGFIALAEQRVASGLAAVAASAVPLFACAISQLFGERPTPREWVGVAIGFVGVVCLALGDLRAAPVEAALLLLAPAGWALGTVLARRVALPRGSMSAATLMIGGGLATLAAAIARGERLPPSLPLRGALAVAYLMVFGSILAFSAYNYLLQHTSTALATSYAYVNPVLALLLGALVGGERPGPGLLAAAALVVTGVVVMASGRRAR